MPSYNEDGVTMTRERFSENVFVFFVFFCLGGGGGGGGGSGLCVIFYKTSCKDNIIWRSSDNIWIIKKTYTCIVTL